jgi:hypothetical protein
MPLPAVAVVAELGDFTAEALDVSGAFFWSSVGLNVLGVD